MKLYSAANILYNLRFGVLTRALRCYITPSGKFQRNDRQKERKNDKVSGFSLLDKINVVLENIRVI